MKIKKGLRASANFGRPNFSELLEQIQENNPSVGKIGVFRDGLRLQLTLKHYCEYDRLSQDYSSSYDFHGGWPTKIFHLYDNQLINFS